MSRIPERLRTVVEDDFRAWMENLASIDVSALDVCLPEGGALADELRWLDVPELAIPEIVASRPDASLRPEARWML
ncbi:MAG: hypothetical protein M3173_07120, partial [Chloroflexota bacterium]|nr:hypothetical protein [Chloroflexota bacterium]